MQINQTLYFIALSILFTVSTTQPNWWDKIKHAGSEVEHAAGTALKATGKAISSTASTQVIGLPNNDYTVVMHQYELTAWGKYPRVINKKLNLVYDLRPEIYTKASAHFLFYFPENFVQRVGLQANDPNIANIP